MPGAPLLRVVGPILQSHSPRRLIIPSVGASSSLLQTGKSMASSMGAILSGSVSAAISKYGSSVVAHYVSTGNSYGGSATVEPLGKVSLSANYNKVNQQLISAKWRPAGSSVYQPLATCG